MVETMTSTTLDIIVLLLRIAVVFLLYFFLYQIVRVLRRDLQIVGTGAAAVAGGGAVSNVNQYGRLIVLSPGATNLRVNDAFDLTAVNVLGRRPDCDVPLNDNFLSAEHALLEWRGDSWWLEDQNSTNGTFVNDIEVRDPTPITYGDIVRVGRVELKLSR